MNMLANLNDSDEENEYGQARNVGSSIQSTSLRRKSIPYNAAKGDDVVKIIVAYKDDKNEKIKKE